MGTAKIECRIGKFECQYREFNLSFDWFGNFECRFANFQRPTLYSVLLILTAEQNI